MTLNHINLVIGFLAGLALGILLRTAGSDDDSNLHVLRKPLRRAAGQ
jgi:hypothetical protein